MLSATPTEIIVYRNPAEAALWQSGIIFPLIVTMVVSVLVALGTAWLLDTFGLNRAKWSPAVVVIVTTAAAIFTMWKLWI